MTTLEHLVYTLQEVYSFHRDLLPLLDSLRHMSTDDRVRRTLQTEIDGIRGEQETTERALNLLGARYKMEHNAVSAGIIEVSERFRHQMAPSRGQQDAHALMVVVSAAAMARSKYQACMEMATVIGEQDVVKLVQEMDSREVTGQADAGELLPQLIQETSTQEIRRRAA